MFPGHLWLDSARLWVQALWLGLFLGALWASFGALWRPGKRVFPRLSRALWTTAVLLFAGMWGAGASLEMLRRVTAVRGASAFLALGAFAFLVIGVSSLVWEWFPARSSSDEEPRETALRGAKIAGSLLALSLAGAWFGGFALPWNHLFHFVGGEVNRTPLPDGWMLSLAGAQLLGAHELVSPKRSKTARVVNPLPATLWLGIVSAVFAAPFILHHAGAAAVAFAGYGVFLGRVWGSRPAFQLKSRAFKRVVVFLWLGVVAVAGTIAVRGDVLWNARAALEWRTPLYGFCFALWLGAVAVFSTEGRFALRLAIFSHFASRSVLWATLAGSAMATVVFGPGGALWWSFWPLAGLFFDLLGRHEHARNASGRAALSHENLERKVDAAPSFSAGSG